VLLNPFDEPPGEGDELPPMEAADDSPAALPRLSIVHLLMWMAATAVAFLPLSLWNPAAAQANAARSTTATLSMSVYGLAAGTYLFVLAALVFWRGRGYRSRFEPGHWLALKGAAGWLQSVLMYSIIFSSYAANTTAISYFQAIRLPVGLVFFMLFMWLALRSPEPARWRWTFAIFAIAPAIGEIVGMALMLTVSSRTPLLHMTSHVGAQAVQALALASAAIGDHAHRTPRHWTHWMAAVVYLIALAASTAIYATYFMFPQLLIVR
jgi:hypothetical protein